MDNKYLTKVAGMAKSAWEGEYVIKGRNEYGVGANEAINNNNVYDMLMEASKDPHVHVRVDHLKDWVTTSGHSIRSPENFRKVMASIKKDIKGNSSGEENMNWTRNAIWTMGMNRDNPILKEFMGKQDTYGDNIDNSMSAVLHYLKTKYKY